MKEKQVSQKKKKKIPRFFFLLFWGFGWREGKVHGSHRCSVSMRSYLEMTFVLSFGSFQIACGTIMVLCTGPITYILHLCNGICS